MIKASELRIGNFVGHQDSDYTSNGDEIHFKGCVASINTGTVTVSDGLTSGTSLSYQELIPIPLTREWLTSLGFKEMPTAEYKDDGNFHLERSWDSVIAFDDRDNLCSYNGCSFWYPTKYVHQLQNLYFALTGEELLVNV